MNELLLPIVDGVVEHPTPFYGAKSRRWIAIVEGEARGRLKRTFLTRVGASYAVAKIERLAVLEFGSQFMQGSRTIRKHIYWTVIGITDDSLSLASSDPKSYEVTQRLADDLYAEELDEDEDPNWEHRLTAADLGLRTR